MKIYAGVGSRQTPIEILHRMRAIARRLATEGWVLRSGAADGADQLFEDGCNAVNPDSKEIYLPWQRFNGHMSRFYNVSAEAMAIAESVIPHWQYLNRPARLLHGRNVYQVLGYDLKTPATMVICWTPEWKRAGGTRTAIVLAESRGIPVYNLAGLPNDEWLDRLQENGYCKLYADCDLAEEVETEEVPKR